MAFNPGVFFENVAPIQWFKLGQVLQKWQGIDSHDVWDKHDLEILREVNAFLRKNFPNGLPLSMRPKGYEFLASIFLFRFLLGETIESFVFTGIEDALKIECVAAFAKIYAEKRNCRHLYFTPPDEKDAFDLGVNVLCHVTVDDESNIPFVVYKC